MAFFSPFDTTRYFFPVRPVLCLQSALANFSAHTVFRSWPAKLYGFGCHLARLFVVLPRSPAALVSQVSGISLIAIVMSRSS